MEVTIKHIYEPAKKGSVTKQAIETLA